MPDEKPGQVHVGGTFSAMQSAYDAAFDTRIFIDDDGSATHVELYNYEAFQSLFLSFTGAADSWNSILL